MRMRRLPRRRFLIALFLVIGVGLFLRFNVYYHVKGWIRGDAYYAGMPTCYWVAKFDSDEDNPGWLNKIYGWLGIPLEDRDSSDWPSLAFGGPSAYRVLMQIAADSSCHERGRWHAILELAYSTPRSRQIEVARLLSNIFANENEKVDFRARVGGVLVGVEAKEMHPEIDCSHLLTNKDGRIAVAAACVLWVRREKLEVVEKMLLDEIENAAIGNRSSWDQALSTLTAYPRSMSLRVLMLLTESRHPAVRQSAVWGMETWVDYALVENGFDREQVDPQRVILRLQELSHENDASVRNPALRTLELLQQNLKKSKQKDK